MVRAAATAVPVVLARAAAEAATAPPARATAAKVVAARAKVVAKVATAATVVRAVNRCTQYDMNSRIQIIIWATLGALLVLGGVVFIGTQYAIPNLVGRQGQQNATTTDASLAFVRRQY